MVYELTIETQKEVDYFAFNTIEERANVIRKLSKLCNVDIDEELLLNIQTLHITENDNQ